MLWETHYSCYCLYTYNIMIMLLFSLLFICAATHVEVTIVMLKMKSHLHLCESWFFQKSSGVNEGVTLWFHKIKCIVHTSFWLKNGKSISPTPLFSLFLCLFRSAFSSLQFTAPFAFAYLNKFISLATSSNEQTRNENVVIFLQFCSAFSHHVKAKESVIHHHVPSTYWTIELMCMVSFYVLWIMINGRRFKSAV